MLWAPPEHPVLIPARDDRYTAAATSSSKFSVFADFRRAAPRAAHVTTPPTVRRGGGRCVVACLWIHGASLVPLLLRGISAYLVRISRIWWCCCDATRSQTAADRVAGRRYGQHCDDFAPTAARCPALRVAGWPGGVGWRQRANQGCDAGGGRADWAWCDNVPSPRTVYDKQSCACSQLRRGAIQCIVGMIAQQAAVPTGQVLVLVLAHVLVRLCHSLRLLIRDDHLPRLQRRHRHE